MTAFERGNEGLVLVVDDDESIRETLVNVLASASVRAVGAGSAKEALKLLRLHEPAVVVVDYRLPDSSGIELAKEIKDLDPEMPVLLLTGFASLDSAIASVGQLDAYLIKPVAPQTFLQTIRNALARRGLVAENKNLVERLQRLNAYQALYDPLTGLPNRALLDDRLSQAIASSRRTGTSLAVLFVDLDGFKVVNDLFGHHVGDQLLREMADRLAEARRSSDTVARFGGDEFVVVCPDVRTSAAACRIAEHLLEELSRPAMVDGVEHRLTASVGIAVTSRGALSQSAETLLRNADTAMYRAKEEGRDGWEIFDDAMRDRVLERFEIERGLRAGMENGDLSLAYQPMVDLRTGAVVGAEALLRWHRAGYGTVLPGGFLSVAEESGLIVPIGRWVLEEALKDLARWQHEQRVPDGFRLWVNVSPHQLANPHFADLVGELMDERDLPLRHLGVEIIEEALRDVGATAKVLQALRELGVSVNLDDFGAGHSNLSWLQELPITGIKIDRRFVANLDRLGDDRGSAIVSGLIGLGKALGLSIVGEGVENRAQADTLERMGCEHAQGYYFGYPGPAAQLWEAPVVGGMPVVGGDGRGGPAGASSGPTPAP
ncbi:MAG TPA: EAL domain-containing protein [Acidimicrobiales bacterium]|nr:EAL domain-containing protein [Acidimicrobiales bacterium]